MGSFRFLIAGLSVCGLIACGGGGGSDSGSEISGGSDLRSNLCSIVGSNLRIINGTRCGDLSNSPVVRLITNYKSGPPGYCSGTLITPTKVLTAGHCGTDINNRNDRRLKTVVLTGDPQNPAVVASAVQVHPAFRVALPRLYNDMAIVTLSHPVNLPVLPVLGSVVPPIGAEVQIFGYGRTQAGTPPPLTFDQFLRQPLDLRAGQMTIVRENSTHLSADAIAGQASLCHGDSGGPLIYLVNGEPTIVGVASQVVANGVREHCAPGTQSEWTRLQAPAVLNELVKLVPDVQLR